MWPFKSKPKPEPKPAAPVSPTGAAMHTSMHPLPMTISPTTDEKYKRHVFRAVNLLKAIEKSEAKGGENARIAEIQTELRRRRGACMALDLELPDSIAELDLIIKANWSR